MQWKDAKNRLTITTTTEHLAKHLGHALKRAYAGDVRYDFSHENKPARVYWHRERQLYPTNYAKPSYQVMTVCAKDSDKKPKSPCGYPRRLEIYPKLRSLGRQKHF